jgi:AbiU2
MNLADAEAKLDDYLLDGIAGEILWAEEAKAFIQKISDHSDAINAAQYGHLFGSLQTIMTDRLMLSVAKIYDRPDRRYPTRSIPAVLELIGTNASIWRLRHRSVLEKLLIDEGRNENLIRSTPDADLIGLVVGHYERSRPDENKASHCPLSAALMAVREARNKVLAHNEAVEQSARNRTTWRGLDDLIAYAKDFVCVISSGFTDSYYGEHSDDFLLSIDAGRLSRDLERLLKLSKLIPAK